jgi:7-cyano-7-deazaguanine reductase
MLKTFELTSARRNYRTTFESSLRSLCPLTGESSLAKITIEYLPGRLGLQTDSLETYLESFGDMQIGREELVTRMLDDLIEVSKAREVVIRAYFATQDGMKITIEAEHPSPARSLAAQR